MYIRKTLPPVFGTYTLGIMQDGILWYKKKIFELLFIFIS